MSHKKIHFFYPHTATLTGQETASNLIADLLGDEFFFVKYPMQGFDRSSRSVVYVIGHLVSVAILWLRVGMLFFEKGPVIYVNLGQSYVSLIREGFPFYLLSLIKPRCKIIFSLHGNNFTLWQKGSFLDKLFLRIVKRGSVITVLGPKQQQSLIDSGLDVEKVRIVNNTCERAGVRYQASGAGCGSATNEPIRLLFLSNLIETKGYREYLNALELLANSSQLTADTSTNQQLSTNNYQLKATLCGKLTDACSSKVSDDAEHWIEEKIDTINKSDCVEVEWIRGAYGDDKDVLFDQADIFVFPTRYHTEAQPIVLIEAMAAGCAVITSTKGEILSMVNDKCAVTLDAPDGAHIAEALNQLVSNSDGTSLNNLANMTYAGRKRYEKLFSNDVYRRGWSDIFDSLRS